MKRTVTLLFISLACFSCAGFIKTEVAADLKNLEKEVYALKSDVGKGDNVIKKGEQVRLTIVVSKDSVKIYGYRAIIEPLKAQKVLVMHLFGEDFPDETFTMDVFKKRFDEVLSPLKAKDVKKAKPGLAEKGIMDQANKERTEEMKKSRSEKAGKDKSQGGKTRGGIR